MKRHFALAACALLTASCATTSGRETVREWSGVYRQGFEVDAFRPCSSREQWWVVGGGQLDSLYKQAAQGPYVDVFFVLRGRISEKGRFGHLGRYPRQLVVEEVVRVEPEREGRC